MSTVEERLTMLEAKVAGLVEAAQPADIDGKFGDPEIRKDPSPKYWTGESFQGRKMSACSPDYLEAFAKYKEACAFMNEREGDATKAKYVGYDRRDAKRARAWAERLRKQPPKASGFAAAAVSVGPSADDNDAAETPF